MNKMFIVTISNAANEVKHRVIVSYPAGLSPRINHVAVMQAVKDNLAEILDVDEDINHKWGLSVVPFSYDFIDDESEFYQCF